MYTDDSGEHTYTIEDLSAYIDSELAASVAANLAAHLKRARGAGAT